MFENAADAIKFMTGGNAKFTLQSQKTGKHFSFKVAKPTRDTEAGGKARDHDADVAFVSVLTGDPNNWQDWQFIGTLFLKDGIRFRPGKGKSIEAPSIKAFDWTMKHLVADQMPPQLVIEHSGSCCRCGKTLTHPESIASGIGPECAKHF